MSLQDRRIHHNYLGPSHMSEEKRKKERNLKITPLRISNVITIGFLQARSRSVWRVPGVIKIYFSLPLC